MRQEPQLSGRSRVYYHRPVRASPGRVREAPDSEGTDVHDHEEPPAPRRYAASRNRRAGRSGHGVGQLDPALADPGRPRAARVRRARTRPPRWRRSEALGVDIVRTNVIFGKIYRRPNDRRKPRGFKTSDPNSSLLRLVGHGPADHLAKANGMQVLLTITGPGPVLLAPAPRRCRTGAVYLEAQAERVRRRSPPPGRQALQRARSTSTRSTTSPTSARPGSPRASSVAAGQRSTGAGDAYRKLWIAGYKADRASTTAPAATACCSVRRRRSPSRFRCCALRCASNSRAAPSAAGCGELQGCSGRVSKLNIGGFAVHPYNQGAATAPRRQRSTPRRPCRSRTCRACTA